MKKLILFLFCMFITIATFAQDKNEVLTLDRAVELALANHPDLEAARQEIAISRGHRTQAGLLPNPTLIMGTEASNPGEGWSSEGAYLVGVSQEIPIFGSMTKTKRLEEMGIALKESQQRIVLLEVGNNVKTSYAVALYWQKVLEILEQLVVDSRQEVEISRSRLEAGDIIPADLAEKELVLAEIVVELNDIRSRKEAALAMLVEAMGNPEVEVGRLAGDLIHPGEIPPLNDLLLKIDENPYLLMELAHLDVSKANLDKVRNSRFPDLELEFKHRWVNEISESRYDFGLSFSLPVFDFKQGETEAAAAEVKLSSATRISRKNSLVSRLRSAHAALQEANRSLKLLMESSLPDLEKQFQMSTALYEEGEISLSEYLPHRREYGRNRLMFLMAQRDTLLAWVELYPFMQ